MNGKGQLKEMALILIFIQIMIFPNILVHIGHDSSIQLPQSKIKYMTTSQLETNFPVIEWPYDSENATYTPVFAWDGAYTGQIQEVWSWTYWVNDTDGVDTVLFRFRWGYEDKWFNRSTVLVEGNSTNGRYNGNLTWGVVWNWVEGRPEWVNGSGNFWFKIFANDTSGNWVETSIIQYTGGYMLIQPPPLYYISIIGQILIIPVIVIIILVIVWKRRTQQK